MVQYEQKAGLFLFFTWALFLIFVAIATGYNGLYGYDSHEYLRYCNRLVDFISNDISPGDYFWPVNYPLMGALLSFITGGQVAMQLISIFGAAWIVYLLAMYLFKEFPGREREVIIYTVLFMGFSPYFFRYSVSSMSDIPALAFACTAYYLIYLHRRTKHPYAVFFVLVFASMAVFTRFALLPLLVPVAISAIFSMIKTRRFLAVVLSIAASLIPVLVYIYFKNENSFVIFQHQLVTEWSIVNFFRNNFNTLDGISQYTVPNIIFVLSFLIHPGFVFPGLLFLAIIFYKRNQPLLIGPLVVIGVIFYSIYIAGIPSRNTRYLVPLLPFYLAVCFPSFMSVLARFHHRKKLLRWLLSGAILVQLILSIRAFIPFYRYNQTERELADKIIAYHPSLLYTFGIDGALRSYGYKGNIINIWEHPLDSLQANSLLLFNRKDNEHQWKGRNPMLNFYFIVDSANANKLESLPTGWEIYEIKEAYTSARSGLSGK